jgi:hypothetical protein
VSPRLSLDDARTAVIVRYHRWLAAAASPGYVGGYRRRKVAS